MREESTQETKSQYLIRSPLEDDEDNKRERTAFPVIPYAPTFSAMDTVRERGGKGLDCFV